MPLGNYNNRDEMRRPSVYGPGFANAKSSIDATRISFEYWKHLLKIAIHPKIRGGDGDYVEWNKDGGIVVYVTPIKAYIIADLMAKFKEDPAKYSGSGVPVSSNGYVVFYDGSVFNHPDHWCMVLGKMNKEGQVESNFAYEFNHGTDFNMIFHNFKDGQFDADYDTYADTEYDSIMNLIYDFARADSRASASAVRDELCWEFERVSNALSKIADGCGVSLSNKQKPSYQKKDNYFSNKASSSYSSGGVMATADLEDL